jgi:hypothetical protein
VKKIATNNTQTIQYTTIEDVNLPSTVIVTDTEGNQYSVCSSAQVGDVLVFTDTVEQPTFMSLESFSVGRTL